MWNPFKTKRPKIQDEFFGKLLCMEVKEPNQNYFEGRRNFKPTAKDIEVVIAGKLGGPTQQQKYFFNWVETNYWRLIEQIGPFVQQEFSKWDKSFRISNLL